MTIVDERPLAPPASTPPPDPDRSWSPTASWRLAARLARREVRRRPGRTLLVALLVAVPVMAMTIGSIAVRSDDGRAAWARSAGQADFAVDQYQYVDDAGDRQDPVTGDDLPAGTLPDGTASVDVLSVWSSVTAVDGRRVDVAATHFDTSSPIVDGIVDLGEGRLPADGTDEVLVHPELADQLDVDVGDRLTLVRPDRTLEVVGVGRSSDDHRRPLLLFGSLERDQVRSWNLTTLVELPPGSSTDAALEAIAASGALTADQLAGFNVRTPDGYWFPDATNFTTQADNDRQALAWGWVVGVLSLAALGVIIAAAFATSARRQLATVGQLAANGASPRLIRRTLSLQGTWSGAVGAAVGIGVGVSAFLLGTPVIERIVNRRWTDTTIAPLDIAVLFLTGIAAATIAALLPARSLAGTSVLSALAGRRPIRPVQARTVTAGVVCFVAGLFLLAVATAAASGPGVDSNDGNLFALVAVLGGLGVLAGMCLASPLAVTAATAVAARLGASWRLSGRSLHRTRWRSAAVVTAIGVAGAFAIAGASVASSLDAADDGPTDLPRNMVLLRSNDGTDIAAFDPAVLRDVRAVVESSTESMIAGLDVAPPSDAQLEAAWSSQSELETDPNAVYVNIVTPYEVTIATPDVMDGMGLSSTDRAALDEIGALTLWANYVGDGPVAPAETPTIPSRLITGDGEIDFEAVGMQEPFTSRFGAIGYLMTEQRAAELGLGVTATGIRFTAADDLTGAQRRSLDEIRFGDGVVSDAWIVGDETAQYPDVDGRGAWIDYQWVNWTPPATLVHAAIIAATLLLVLLVVAIGLSLAAVESRDERNTLIAIGASPSTLRRRSATTATVLAATGGVIAVPTGLLPVWVISRVSDGSTATIPWLSIAAIVVVVPLLVGAIALAGSAVVQRIRPPEVMQTFTD